MLDQVRPGLPGEEIIRRIEKALAIDGTHTWADVREMLFVGSAQIFWNQHGAWITQILPAPQRRLLSVWIVAGELPEVMEVQEQVERFAQSEGCDEIVAPGCRLGWGRTLPHYGWREHAVVWTHPVREVNRV